MTAEPAPLFETDVSGLAARCTAARGSDVLAVVFSQVRVPAGRFGLSRLFARTSHACLFLNQPENRWYRGVEDAVDRVIDRAAALVGPRRVVLYGSSMGAFGAVAAAARRPEAEAVVFAPDFRIGEAGSQSAAAGLAAASGEPDLTDLLARRRSGRIDVAVGLFDPYDAGVAARLAGAGFPDAVRLVPLASSHELHDHLYSLNVIRRVIAGFSRDLAAEAASKGLAIAVSDWAPYRRFAALAEAFRAGEPVDPAAVRDLGLTDNPGMALLEAEALAASGDVAGAERRLAGLDAAVRSSRVLSSLTKRYLKEIPRRRIALLERLGRRDAALAVAARAAAEYPSDESFAAAAGGRAAADRPTP